MERRNHFFRILENTFSFLDLRFLRSLTHPSTSNGGIRWKLWRQDAYLHPRSLRYSLSFEDLGVIKNMSKLEKRLVEYTVCCEEELPIGSSYCFFQEWIHPTWEDDANRFGGRFPIFFTGGASRQDVDRHWQTLLLGLMDGDFKKVAEHICGIKVCWKVPPRSPTITFWVSEDMIHNPKLMKRLEFIVTFLFSEVENPSKYTYNGYQTHESKRREVNTIRRI